MPERNIKDIPTAEESLRRAVSLKFYRSLVISPVKGWDVVRGQLVGNRLVNNRVIHSELGGDYDSITLQLADNLHIEGNSSLGRARGVRNVLVHALVYDCADGQFVISFANFEDPGGSQWHYSGGAWMGVEKANHLWVVIEPLHLGRYEARGPRTYTLGVEAPGPVNVRLPRAVGVTRMMSR